MQWRACGSGPGLHSTTDPLTPTTPHSPPPAGVYKPAAWMSSSAQDLISRMLTLDPEQRITLEAVWAHPWVASAPRWEPQGVGTGRLYRALTDPTSGAVLPDDAGEPGAAAVAARAPRLLPTGCGYCRLQRALASTCLRQGMLHA